MTQTIELNENRPDVALEANPKTMTNPVKKHQSGCTCDKCAELSDEDRY